MPLILPLNKSGSGRRASPTIKYKAKVIMMNKEQMMEKTKLELNKMLAQVGNNISASKLKNTNKETLVQMIFDAQPIDIPADSEINTDNLPIGANVQVVCDKKSYDKFFKNVVTAQKNLDQKNAETESIINEDEPKNIDEMFDGKVVSLADVKDQKNLKNGKTPKLSSRPDYDKLYDEFKKALKNDMGLNLFANRTNRLGEMKALTHIKNMQWAVLITKTGFRFELFMMDDPENINKLYLAMNKHGRDFTEIVGPTGSSKRHKICATHDGHNTKEQAQKFYHFYELLMVGISDVYPLPKSVTKTA